MDGSPRLAYHNTDVMSLAEFLEMDRNLEGNNKQAKRTRRWCTCCPPSWRVVMGASILKDTLHLSVRLTGLSRYVPSSGRDVNSGALPPCFSFLFRNVPSGYSMLHFSMFELRPVYLRMGTVHFLGALDLNRLLCPRVPNCLRWFDGHFHWPHQSHLLRLRLVLISAWVSVHVALIASAFITL
jgi:hypothetical protein